MPDDATDGVAEHSSRLQPSTNLHVPITVALVPRYYPEGIKARVSSVHSIEPHKILAPTRVLNQGPSGSQSRVVTTILPLHTQLLRLQIEINLKI